MVLRHKSAKKRHRQSLKRRMRNKHYKSLMKTFIKKVLAKIEEKADKEEVKQAYIKAQSIIDRVERKGIIKKNTAARKKSKLAKKVNAYLAAE